MVDRALDRSGPGEAQIASARLYGKPCNRLWFEAGPMEISALMAGGLVLFVMTLTVNSIAAIIINRSRSGVTTAAD